MSSNDDDDHKHQKNENDNNVNGTDYNNVNGTEDDDVNGAEDDDVNGTEDDDVNGTDYNDFILLNEPTESELNEEPITEKELKQNQIPLNNDPSDITKQFDGSMNDFCVENYPMISVPSLIEASKNGDIKVVKDCLEGGISHDCIDSCGKNPLYYACENNFFDIIKLLLMYYEKQK